MIETDLAWDAVLNATGALVMAAFGTWILTLTPRSRTTRALGLFALVYGAAYVPLNLLVLDGIHFVVAAPMYTAAFVVAGWNLTRVGLELVAGGGDTGRARRAVVAAAIGGGTVALVDGAVATWPAALADPLGWQAAYAAYIAGYAGFFGAFIGVPTGLAVAYRSAHASRQRAEMLLVTLALVLWPALYAGWAAYHLALAGSPVLIGYLVIVVTFSALWIRNVAIDGSLGGRSRDLALLVPAMALLAVVLAATFQDRFSVTGQGPHWGVARLLGVGVFAYAILRHQVLGIDVKARWTISKTTVAAVFIAVFFVTSEVAQQFFGETLGSTYVGIGAAGMLVFAIAPLQRVAERFAEKAVPVAGAPVAPEGRADREEAYRRALRIALRDRVLAREEEVHLHEVAEHMGIGAGRAMALRVEVERELEHGREVR